MDKKIEFITGDTSLLDEIKELWEELNQFHIEKSVDFKNHYKAFTFAARKESIVRHIENGALLVAIAYCNNLKIGYCISSVVDGIGEIDSIFVKTGYRKSEEVFGFYSKYGFAPCLTELQII